MKKIFTLLLAFLFCLGLMGCSGEGEPLRIMVKNILYFSEGEAIPGEVDPSAIAGTILTTVPRGKDPWDNAQANFDCVGAEYALVEEGVVVKVENEWILFTVDPRYAPYLEQKKAAEKEAEDNSVILREEFGKKDAEKQN